MASDATCGSIRLGAGDIQIPSDALAKLWPILNLLQEHLPGCVAEVLQIAIVLDACTAQRELRWRLGRRREPSARTALHELMAAGVVSAFAPLWLDQEIRDHVAEMAHDCGVPVVRVLDEWEDFKRLIRFYQPAALERSAGPDADDLPYLATRSELALDGIVTTDQHFRQARAPVITIGILPALRTYARTAAVRVTISAAGLAVGGAAIGAAVLAAKAFVSLPGVVQVGPVFAAVVAVAHPTSRRAIADLLRKSGVALEIMGDAFAAYSAAAAAEKAALARVQSALPRPRRPTALAYARRVCARAGRPLSLVEIETQMRSDGLQTRARIFTPYLRRIMRGSGQFVEVSPNRWALAASAS